MTVLPTKPIPSLSRKYTSLALTQNVVAFLVGTVIVQVSVTDSKDAVTVILLVKLDNVSVAIPELFVIPVNNEPFFLTVAYSDCYICGTGGGVGYCVTIHLSE